MTDSLHRGHPSGDAQAEVEAFVAQQTEEARALLASVRAYCFRLLGDLGSDTVDDLMGTILLKVWERRGTYRGDGLKFWVFIIARNHMYDHLRGLRTGRKIFQDVTVLQDHESPDANAPMEVLAVDAHAATPWSESDSDDGAQDLGDAAHESLITRMDMGKALRTLSREGLQVVYLCVIEGYTRAEAAEHLGIPMGTITSRLMAALKNLRKVLEEEAP